MKDLTPDRILAVFAECEEARKNYLQSLAGLPIILNRLLPPDAIYINVGENVYAELMELPDGKKGS